MNSPFRLGAGQLASIDDARSEAFAEKTAGEMIATRPAWVLSSDPRAALRSVQTIVTAARGCGVTKHSALRRLIECCVDHAVMPPWPVWLHRVLLDSNASDESQVDAFILSVTIRREQLQLCTALDSAVLDRLPLWMRDIEVSA